MDDCPIINGFPTEDGVTNNILDYLYSNDVTKKDVENCMHRISIFLNNKDKEIENWELSTEEKESFIETWDNDMFDHAPDKVKNLVVKYVFELENCDSEVALKFLAYGYYCGNSIFPCDFFKSRDYLLRLISHDKDGFYANTLGYIYYYGRCNNKVPEYDLAYKYYTLGHFHGVYESTYKLADMFLKGYGVNKDVKIAYNFVSSVYYDNIRKLRKDKAVKLADAALRMGTIVLKEELFGIVDYDRAYYYYLIANFAIELRKKQKDHVGDSKVDAAIKKCLEETYPKTSYKKSKKIKPNSLSQMLEPMMIEGDEIFASIENRGGKYFLTLRNNNKRGRMFVVIPEVGFCGRLDEIKFEIHNFDDSKISETGKYNFVFTEISNNTFFNNGDKDITIYCDYYTVVTNIKKSEKEYCIVSACYVPNGKVYDFLCDKMDYNVGDIVNVKEQSINCEVMITNISMRKKSELVFPLNMYKHIK